MSAPQPENNDSVDMFGREFHEFSVQHGVYCVPIDEPEEDRLNEFHEILVGWVPIGRLILPDLGRSALTDVLDCGCGSGIWADQVAEEFQSDVIGIDLSCPPDFEGHFERWNLNAPLRSHPNGLASAVFDLINSRCLTGGIDSVRWPSYVRDLFDHLKVGGWLQMTEASMNIQSDSGRGDELESISRWWELYSTALTQQGRDPRAGSLVADSSQRAWSNLGSLMTEVGFVNTTEEQHRLPIGEWSPDANSRVVGARVLEQMRATLESLGVWACCQVHGMTTTDFEELIDGCIEDMQDPGLRLYIPLYLVWGQKPPMDQRNGVCHSQSMSPPSFRVDDLAVQPVQRGFGSRR